MYAQHEQKEMVLYERQQNWAGRNKENAGFAKAIHKEIFCAISLTNKNNNNRDINVARKKELKNILADLIELELPLYELLLCPLKHISQ